MRIRIKIFKNKKKYVRARARVNGQETRVRVLALGHHLAAPPSAVHRCKSRTSRRLLAIS